VREFFYIFDVHLLATKQIKINSNNQQSTCNANAMPPGQKEYVREFLKTFLMPTYQQGIQIFFLINLQCRPTQP